MSLKCVYIKTIAMIYKQLNACTGSTQHCVPVPARRFTLCTLRMDARPTGAWYRVDTTLVYGRTNPKNNKET